MPAPIEHFERWDIHKEGTQAAIRRVTDALDAERIAVREALGYGAPHFPLANHYAAEGEEWMYGRGSHDRLTDSGDWRERIVLTEHRYMLEDVRIGLSFLVSVARARRRRDAARARVPGDRRRDLRRGFHGHRPHAREPRSRPSRSRGIAGAAARRLCMSARARCLPRRRPHGPRHRGGIRLCRPSVTIVDFKPREAEDDFRKLAAQALAEVEGTLAMLAGFGLFEASAVDRVMSRVSGRARSRQGAAVLPAVDVIFEGIPEVLDLKRDALARASALAGPLPIIASTTSTILVDDSRRARWRTRRASSMRTGSTLPI